MARFLITSLVLTVALNLALRMIPGLPERLNRWIASLAGGDHGSDDNRRPSGPGPDAEPRRPPPGRQPAVRVIVPWKAMLIGSAVLTVLVNLALRLG